MRLSEAPRPSAIDHRFWHSRGFLRTNVLVGPAVAGAAMLWMITRNNVASDHDSSGESSFILPYFAMVYMVGAGPAVLHSIIMKALMMRLKSPLLRLLLAPLVGFASTAVFWIVFSYAEEGRASLENISIALLGSFAALTSMCAYIAIKS